MAIPYSGVEYFRPLDLLATLAAHPLLRNYDFPLLEPQNFKQDQ